MQKQQSTQVNFDVLIEITKDSNMKYEFDKKLKRIRLDRVLHGTNVYPGDYGFVERTLELDGDPVDVLIYTNHPTFPGCTVTVKIIGGLAMIDDNEVDTKLIAVSVSDPEMLDIDSLDKINENWKNKVWDFFLNYKNIENKKTLIEKWLNATEALQVLFDCQKRYQRYKNLIENDQTAELKKVLLKELRIKQEFN